MQVFRRLMCLIAVLAPMLAAAAPINPQPGVEYVVLPTPQNTDTGKKIEVIEFFAYYCPHCNAFEPELNAWVKKQGERIVLKRVPIALNEDVLVQQKLYFTLQAMGELDRLHQKVYDAIHKERLRMNRDEMVFDWVAKQGVDRQKFADTFRSFGVAAAVRRAKAMMDAYKIDYWPRIIIDGRFQTSPSQAAATLPDSVSEAEQNKAALQVMDVLVSKAISEKK
ncbi:thiol:disulfide interchange protein DsbA/DsbL [Massilia sp. TS11]|uniref:thiol:disulfide interchange protein DsbA/DsbL n=1 Tax=Massilia sp. TS11 TaxID=2908003 RepID=UPI001ED9D429|nr:thiol:disulfide interchange protein DsbA/DsbL [Massilia sp. TS11]MCG2585476.1 thiol:disulfide interchange protein DsbA/DsbL [Massilia sp. TS11]